MKCYHFQADLSCQTVPLNMIDGFVLVFLETHRRFPFFKQVFSERGEREREDSDAKRGEREIIKGQD
jgi:hypothetical protein